MNRPVSTILADSQAGNFRFPSFFSFGFYFGKFFKERSEIFPAIFAGFSFSSPFNTLLKYNSTKVEE
ncbi:hypothetical protein A2778_01085 [Candidatus Daviesbacteria bacterium RIFCSPHIGHO2_01_FULL_40_24]|nr:MAG: hypothetical protein A2778_01085 [Candidatus Daviesbacteria bacterium RIFCSPHIGHO2_01_FULL_40_24]OGE29801.1 MAG: hypothetical protein A3C29_00715 [Candidatus Daviesbacteria bacterium RIFCSPHIGHO2_02_FULL_40_16]OGE42750.1 MAG: hypothetical protein A3A53_05535 [Candidatus Daviesbacteria bacterium RIFCSPLOWO2_01_FULL_39_23]OGE67278.1 MAG: hypothetical protein A3J16_06255 [Candidatus Daviesbacteria bacterium RIFCSPLOWO2_02_FULL_39_13]